MGDHETMLVTLCRADERLRRLRKESKEERAEHTDASKTLAGMLLGVMQKHDLRCLATTNPDGSTLYVRSVDPTRRACRIPDAAAAIRLVEEALQQLPSDATTDQCLSAVKSLALERGTSTPVRLSTLVHRPRGVTLPPTVPKEASVLLDQYAHARGEYQAFRSKWKRASEPLRVERKACEAALVLALDQPAKVQMRDVDTGKAHTLTVATKTRSPQITLPRLLDALRTALNEGSRAELLAALHPLLSQTPGRTTVQLRRRA